MKKFYPLLVLLVLAATLAHATVILNLPMTPATSNATFINDTSGLGNNGYFNGSVTYDSTLQAVNFTAHNASFITLGNSSALNKINSSNNFSISIWFRPNNASVQQYLIFKASSWDIRLSNNARDVSFFDLTNFAGVASNGDYFSSNGDWMMVTLVYNATVSNAHSWQIYVNGTLCTITSDTGNFSGSASQNLTIGKTNDPNLNASIGLIIIDNTSLNSTQVMQRYDAYRDSFGYNQNGTYNFSQQIGQVRPDFYGANTHGLLLADNWSVDTNGDGSADTPGNTTYMRNLWTQANLTKDRLDSNLQYVTASSDPNNPNISFLTGQTNLFDINAVASSIRYAWQMNYTIGLTIGGMPSWLANTSASCSSHNATCPPINWTTWQTLVIAYTKNVTNNGQYSSVVRVSVCNECDLNTSWMYDSARTNVTRSVFYNNLYNFTYMALKTSNFTGIQVGGMDLASFNTSILIGPWLGNFSAPKMIDFNSFHEYQGQDENTGFDQQLPLDYANYYALCAVYGTNCSKLDVNEFNVWNAATQVNDSVTDQQQLALAYLVTLNSYPSNVSLTYYQFGQTVNCTASVSDGFPHCFDAVSDPLLMNRTFPSYSVIKNFTTIIPGGAMVLNSTTSQIDVKTTVGVANGKKRLAVVNKKSIGINYTVMPTGIANVLRLADINSPNTYAYSAGAFAPVVVPAFSQAFLEIQTTPIVSNISTTYVGSAAYTSFAVDQPANVSLCFGSTPSLGTCITNSSMSQAFNISTPNLAKNQTVYVNITVTTSAGDNATNATNFTAPVQFNLSGLVLTTNASNTTLNLSGLTVFADETDVLASNIYVANMSYNVTGATFNITYNFTTANITRTPASFLNISGTSPNLIQVTSNLSSNATATIIVGTGGIVPSSSLLTFPDGSSLNPAYSYDNTTSLITVNATLPPGVSNLTLDSVTPLLENASSSLGLSITSGQTVVFSVDAVDNGPFPNLQSVGMNVTQNGGVVQVIPMSLSTGNTYRSASTILSLAAGTYNLSFWDNDTAGNMNFTSLSLSVQPTGSAPPPSSGGGGWNGGTGAIATILNNSPNATTPLPPPVVVPAAPSFVDFGAAQVRVNSVLTFLGNSNFPLFAMILGFGFIIFILVKW